MRTKNLFFIIFLFLLFGNMVAFAQQPIPKKPSKKGDISYGLRYAREAERRVMKYGKESMEVVGMYTLAIDEFEKYIQNEKNKDLLNAHLILGQIYHNAPTLLRDLDKALNHLIEAEKRFQYNEKITEADKGILYLHLGKVYLKKGDFETALSYYQQSSSGECLASIAELNWLGLGVEQNLPKAMELYKSAALAGLDFWSNIYGIEYQIKEYEKENYDNPAMQLFLDYFYLKTLDNEEKIWMKKLTESADLGYPPALIDLWIFNRERGAVNTGMPYLQKAVDADFVPAYFHLGYVYHLGLGGTANYQEAQKWYEKAAIQGHPLAQSNLGALYYSNLIKAQEGYSNYEMCYYWWNVSAEQGFSPAVYNRTLVASYKAPQSKFERTVEIINSIASIMNSSLEVYNTLNKSKMQAYHPQSQTINQPQQNNNNELPSYSVNDCNKRQKNYTEDEEQVKYWMSRYKDQWVTYYKDKAAGKTGSLYNVNVSDQFKQIQHYQSSMKAHRKICPSIPQSELETITPKTYIKKTWGIDVDF